MERKLFWFSFFLFLVPLLQPQQQVEFYIYYYLSVAQLCVLLRVSCVMFLAVLLAESRCRAGMLAVASAKQWPTLCWAPGSPDTVTLLPQETHWTHSTSFVFGG